MTNIVERYSQKIGSFERIAIIGDIHGNMDGLKAVFNDIKYSRCDGIVCLGDMMDGGLCDIEVVETIKQRDIPTVLGNHDEICRDNLPQELYDFVFALPEIIAVKECVFTHISPRQKLNKIADRYEAWNVFNETSFRRIFVGHAHIPQLYGERSEESAGAAEYSAYTNEIVGLDPSDRYIICNGSIGYPRDCIYKPRYTIYDRPSDSLEFRDVDGPVLDINKPCIW